MSAAVSSPSLLTAFRRTVETVPLPLALVVLALVAAFTGGLSAADALTAFNTGFGRALGDFALLLIPSFIIAGALARRPTGGAAWIAAWIAPVAGAGMVCPDTAYATLSPLAGPHRLRLAMGAYAGFKLLMPAGPLIVATGMGVNDSRLLVLGLVLLVPVWAAGEVWLRLIGATAPAAVSTGPQARDLTAFVPFAVLLVLILAGKAVGPTGWPVLDFLLTAKGALATAAVWALATAPAGQRRDIEASALRRSGDLLLVIGAASGLGAILTQVIPVAGWVAAWGRPEVVPLALFAVAAVFKAVQGSSMATFAAVAPIAAPLASATDPVTAVYAVCLGAFVAILPNDSFYWLVRRDALTEAPEGRAVLVLAGGALVQALAGLLILLVVTAV